MRAEQAHAKKLTLEVDEEAGYAQSQPATVPAGADAAGSTAALRQRQIVLAVPTILIPTGAVVLTIWLWATGVARPDLVDWSLFIVFLAIGAVGIEMGAHRYF